MWLLCHLRLVPAVVWSGIISSLLTLLGVILINRNNNYRLTEQLRREAEEKAASRLHELRKSVYLTAAEHATKALSFLSALPTTNPQGVENSESFLNIHASIAKVCLTGTTDTVQAAMAFQAAFSEAFLKFFLDLQPLYETKAMIETIQIHYDRSQQEIQQILDKMALLNETSNPDPNLKNVLRHEFEGKQNLAKKLSTDSQNEHSKLTALHIKFTRNLEPEILKFAQLQTELMVALRKELGVATDTVEIDKIIKEQILRMKATMSSSMQRLEKMAERLGPTSDD